MNLGYNVHSNVAATSNLDKEVCLSIKDLIIVKIIELTGAKRRNNP